jgi:hypothetical protein
MVGIMTATSAMMAKALSGGTGKSMAAKDSPSVRMMKLAKGFCLIIVLRFISFSFETISH